jgi:hypothetical protein
MTDQRNSSSLCEKSCLVAEVVFGRPGRKCRGHGICRIMEINSSRCRCNSAFVEIEKRSENQLNFQFFIGEIEPSLLSRLLENEKFQVDESFLLPDFIHSRLNLIRRAIPIGAYPIFSTKEGWNVIFQLE